MSRAPRFSTLASVSPAANPPVPAAPAKPMPTPPLELAIVGRIIAAGTVDRLAAEGGDQQVVASAAVDRGPGSLSDGHREVGEDRGWPSDAVTRMVTDEPIAAAPLT